MNGYKSGRSLATATTVLVAAQLVLMPVSAVTWLLAAARAAADDPRGMALMAVLAVLPQTLALLCFIAGGIVFLVWVYRSMGNLLALGSTSCRFSPAAAVWSFFIPVVNLWRIYQVMATLWVESQPPVINENGYALKPKTTLVNWWWGTYLLGVVVSLFVQGTPHTLEEFRSKALMLSVSTFFQVIIGAQFLWLVRATQRRQDEQWLDLERRAAAPRPSADVLR